MNFSLVCLLVFVGTAAAFRGKFFDVKEKATEICESDEECLANIDANAKKCIFAMKGKRGHGSRGRFGKGGRKGDGGPGGRKGSGSFKDKKEDKKRVIVTCLKESNVTETEVAELESLRKWEFKDGLKKFFESLEETDPTLAEDIHCCIGQNVEPPVIGEDKQLLLENIKNKMTEKMDDEDEASLLETFLTAADTCAASFTACSFLDFKSCTIRQCIKLYSATTELEA